MRDVTVVPAEGARVAFAICPRCFVAILLDPRVEGDPVLEHERWHRVLDDAISAAVWG